MSNVFLHIITRSHDSVKQCAQLINDPKSTKQDIESARLLTAGLLLFVRDILRTRMPSVRFVNAFWRAVFAFVDSARTQAELARIAGATGQTTEMVIGKFFQAVAESCAIIENIPQASANGLIPRLMRTVRGGANPEQQVAIILGEATVAHLYWRSKHGKIVVERISN